MVPFYFNANRVDPQSAAVQGSNEFIVESVLERILCKVRWLNYETSHATWDPWKSLHSVDKFYSYLKEIGHPRLFF